MAGILLDNGAWLDAGAVLRLQQAASVLVVGEEAIPIASTLGRHTEVIHAGTFAEAVRAIDGLGPESLGAAVIVDTLSRLDARTQKKLLDALGDRLAANAPLYLLEPNTGLTGGHGWQFPEKARPHTHDSIAKALAVSGLAIETIAPRCGGTHPEHPLGRALARFAWAGALTGAWMCVCATPASDIAVGVNEERRRGAAAFLRHSRLLILLLFLAFLCRLPSIEHAPLGQLFWRQTQTLMVARNFARHDLNIFRPEVDFRRTVDPTERGYVGGTELQVIPWVSAVLYRIFGESPWTSHLPPVMFFLLGLAYFHRLAARWRDETTASLATLFLAVSPMYWCLSLAHMPEAFVFCASFAALYYYQRWIRHSATPDFVYASVAAALTLLGKPQFGVIALPLFVITVLEGGWKRVADRRLPVFAVVVGVPALLYLWYSYRVVAAETGLSFAQPDLLRYQSLLDPAYYALIGTNLFQESVGPLACIAAVGGIMYVPRRRAAPEWVAYGWFAAVIAFFLLMPGGNRVNSYYQAMMAPPACFFAAKALSAIPRGHRQRWAAAVAAFAIVGQSVSLAVPLLQSSNGENALTCGRWLDANLPKSAKVLSLTPDPGTLYFADRTGWICWRQNKGEVIERTPATVEQARANGAAVAVAVGEYPFDNAQSRTPEILRKLSEYLNDRYECLRTRDYAVYFLGRPANLATAVPGILFGAPESRKHLRGTWGPDQRTSQLETFVSLGPSPKGRIVFETPPEAEFAVSVIVASAAPNQEIIARLDGGEKVSRYCLDAWVRHTMDLGSVKSGPEKRLHTLDFEVQGMKREIGLLLYALQLD